MEKVKIEEEEDNSDEGTFSPECDEILIFHLQTGDNQWRPEV